jgi:hypothetical protein
MKLKSLRKLDLRRAGRLSLGALLDLTSLPELRSLRLGNCGLDRAAVLLVKDQRPHCNIQLDL